VTTRTLPFAVYLFDIDGTLVSAGGAGRRAFERAVADRCGPANGALEGLRLDGLTDRLIVRRALALLGRPFDDAFCDDLLSRYVHHLRTEIDGPGYAVLPGAVAALEALRARGALLGLCTGNVEAGARLKLRRGGLDAWFDWGASAVFGFAHDGEEREKLVHAALRRAGSRLGRPLAPREALVVGDTPHDVAAAHHAGCPVLAIATGRFSEEELRACGADHVAPTLADAGALGILLGDRPPAA
jgi:phosphoglycolate phosphatase-like HAD superfamily hydrolase